jgi:hypothetical protein
MKPREGDEPDWISMDIDPPSEPWPKSLPVILDCGCGFTFRSFCFCAKLRALDEAFDTVGRRVELHALAHLVHNERAAHFARQGLSPNWVVEQIERYARLRRRGITVHDLLIERTDPREKKQP